MVKCDEMEVWAGLINGGLMHGVVGEGGCEGDFRNNHLV